MDLCEKILFNAQKLTPVAHCIGNIYFVLRTGKIININALCLYSKQEFLRVFWHSPCFESQKEKEKLARTCSPRKGLPKEMAEGGGEFNVCELFQAISLIPTVYRRTGRSDVETLGGESGADVARSPVLFRWRNPEIWLENGPTHPRCR
jgi:hypothetical protein